MFNICLIRLVLHESCRKVNTSDVIRAVHLNDCIKIFVGLFRWCVLWMHSRRYPLQSSSYDELRPFEGPNFCAFQFVKLIHQHWFQCAIPVFACPSRIYWNDKRRRQLFTGCNWYCKHIRTYHLRLFV